MQISGAKAVVQTTVDDPARPQHGTSSLTPHSRIISFRKSDLVSTTLALERTLGYLAEGGLEGVRAERCLPDTSTDALLRKFLCDEFLASTPSGRCQTHNGDSALPHSSPQQYIISNQQGFSSSTKKSYPVKRST